MNVRLDGNTARYIELASSYHGCTKTDFITKQGTWPEFIEVKFKGIKPLLNLMSNGASNLNQIARALNIIKNSEDKMTEEQFQIIKENYHEIKNLFGEHDEAMRKCLLEIYNISKTKKIRPIIVNEKEEDVNYLFE